MTSRASAPAASRAERRIPLGKKPAQKKWTFFRVAGEVETGEQKKQRGGPGRTADKKNSQRGQPARTASEDGIYRAWVAVVHSREAHPHPSPSLHRLHLLWLA
ncbi:hypothetical protein TEQG_04911 [Trichophyton equinum CBS 127.97]|uniref:Uncharacterized protein n=1 Tax=Trichophyton equinum (strain ATCC MYA-4606 / CBS 127.97) TaxID=559882 RepID=F2PVI3_TRIEC|nr:hypothetical protein TEQG_04911 [Trichophyton equinum CBS 127.97]